MAGVISSVMEEIVKSFAGQSFKKQTIINAMKNRGVKDAELAASGMKKFIEDYKGEKISVDELQSVITKRNDKIGIKDQGQLYSHIKEQPTKNLRKEMYAIMTKHFNIQDDKDLSEGFGLLAKSIDPMYSKERREEAIGQFRTLTNMHSNEYNKVINQAIKETRQVFDKGQYSAKVYTKGESHGIDNHFGVSNYYSHVRYTDKQEGNVQTRYVHELQSDVHQGAKDIKELDDKGLEFIQNSAHDIFNAHVAEWHKKATSENLQAADFDGFHSIQDLINSAASDRPITVGVLHDVMGWVQPINNESTQQSQKMVDAINGAGAYLKNIQKDTKFTQDEDYLKNTINKLIVDSANEGKQSVKFRIAHDDNLSRSEGVQQWYEKDVVNTLAKQAKKIGSEMKMTNDGYTEIAIPEKDFKLPMYSVAGLGVLTASVANKEAMAALPTKIQQAKDKGLSEDYIKQYLAPKYDENTVSRALQMQDPYKNLKTKLNDTQEQNFQKWKAINAPNDSGVDYDLRGAYLKNLTRSKDNNHFSDEFKLPNHPTFSNQSKFAKDYPEKAGSWLGEGPDAQYQPPTPFNTMLNNTANGVQP